MERIDFRPGGLFATPYGLEVETLESDDPRVPGGFVFSAEAAAICAGIHDPKQRARFVAEARRSGDIPLFQAKEYGGFCPLLRLPLPTPKEPAYPSVPTEGVAAMDGASCREIIDRWVDRATLCGRWFDRAPVLLDLCVGQIDAVKHSTIPGFVVGFPLSLMVTSTLENLGESDLDCLEAAAFYALTLHDEWRKAGLDWLYPIRDTWWRDWIKARQGYRRVAKLMTTVHDDLPPWLYGRGL